jgi:hypothetical protein
MTPAQARAAGVPDARDSRVSPTPPAVNPGKVKRRRRQPEPYRTVCHTCGEELTSQAAETRHLNATGHACYQLVLVVQSGDGADGEMVERS